jgi:hypothetical protein
MNAIPAGKGRRGYSRRKEEAATIDSPRTAPWGRKTF